MHRRVRVYSGSLDGSVSERELENRKLSRRAASEGIVLMKNNGVLPISKNAKVFLAGDGAIVPRKGGTGSGDVNEREIVDIISGIENAGIEVVNGDAVKKSIADYKAARLEYREDVLKQMEGFEAGSDMNLFAIIEGTPVREYKKISITKADVEKSDVAVYVISRIAGEGFDRYAKEGDYYLSADEKNELQKLSELTSKIIVLINTGGQIDLNDLVSNKSVAAILNISQGGMEMGNALADVLVGDVTPSGKLINTWAKEYNDFPSSENFSHNNDNVEYEDYNDGIYVGYRYFDSFGVKPEFAFGYGLSYTNFAFSEQKLSVKKGVATVSLRVTNIGDKFSGKEVAQVYVACPQTELKKEFKRLVGYQKTKEIEPGKSQVIKVTFDSKTIASFDEWSGDWIVEAGEYGVFVGNASDNVTLIGALNVEKSFVIEHVNHILPLQKKLDEIVRPDEKAVEFENHWKAEAFNKGIKALKFVPVEEQKAPAGRTDLDDIAANLAAKLTDDELTAILMGEITKGQDNLKNNELVKTGIFVPGAAGETTCQLEEKYDIPAVSMADGPAGIRVLRSYDVDKKTGFIYSKDILSCVENGFFAQDYDNKNVDKYYMYATAIPIGTCLAQTFDPELVSEVGRMVGGEMTEFGISWWLAPGMNIHRNPLCGRNFEYYSEDPIVAGTMAAAMTLGVQSVPGVGTTIKHFACNNQEDNRLHVSSNVSERALREIYLRGFEIAIKKSQPMCIMTSYNRINEIHAANSYDICTTCARDEWGFAGVIMTDWTTTTAGSAKSHVCAIAGNDLIMPGNQIDVDDIKAALKDGSLPRETARACAARLIKVLFQTLGMEEVEPYSKQFKF